MSDSNQFKNNISKEDEQKLIQGVDETRITLVDEKDKEHEFMIFDEIENEGNDYLVLISCDEHDEQEGELFTGEGDDFTIVRVMGEGDNMYMSAISDTEELRKVANIVEAKIDHLSEKPEI